MLDPGSWAGKDGRVTDLPPPTGAPEDAAETDRSTGGVEADDEPTPTHPDPAAAHLSGEPTANGRGPTTDPEPAAPVVDGAASAAPVAPEPALDPPPAEPRAPLADGGSPLVAEALPDVTLPADSADGAAPAEVTAPRSQRAIPPLPRVIAVANQKGGVGKTTTAVNLGACLADLGYRTLVVDLDPQGNASTGLGINIRGLQASMYDVILSDVPIEDCIEASSVRNLFVAPASLDLAGAEIELVPAFSRELRLKQALHEVRDDYDYVLIDCPPSLGLLTINGMAAATEVLVPIQCEYYALEGLGQLLRNVGLVQKNLNRDLDVSTIVLVMYDARTKLAGQVAQEVRDHFGDKVCRIVIPRTVRLSEAPSFGQPIIAFDPSSRGAVAYRELAKEVSGGPA